MNDPIYVECPHCGGSVMVMPNEVNCRIFRHGIHKSTGQPIHPHEDKESCDRLVREDLIWGCGKPFILSRSSDDGTFVAQECDYI